jgi:D-arabinose 1-dehydrogenase-like Zn-dependent alcohol dehydrogenase
MNKNIYQNNSVHTVDEETFLSARIHKYQSLLIIDKIVKPLLTNGEQILLYVGARGLYHTDLPLINGEWKDIF